MTPKALRLTLGWSVPTMTRHLRALRGITGHVGRTDYLSPADVALLTRAAAAGVSPRLLPRFASDHILTTDQHGHHAEPLRH